MLKLVQKSTLHLLNFTASLPFSSYSFILMQMSKYFFIFPLAMKQITLISRVSPDKLYNKKTCNVSMPPHYTWQGSNEVHFSYKGTSMSFFFDHIPVFEQGTGNFCRLTTSLVVHSDKAPGLLKYEILAVITRSDYSIASNTGANIRLWSVKGRRDVKRSCSPFFH